MSDLPENLLRLIKSDLPPVRKCFSFLRKAIMPGYLKKGQHVVERELAQLLGISRSPIREAIRQLESENLLAHSPNKGCVVVGLSVRDIREMYELREVLECFLVRRIVAEGNIGRLEALRWRTTEAYDARSARSSGDDGAFNFHLSLLELVEHRWLKRFLGQLEDYIDQFHVLSYLRKGREKMAFKEHLALLDAMIAGEADEAERLIRSHIKASLEALMAASALF